MTAESPTENRFLGIEGGGTRTVSLLADGNCKLLRRIETGPANLKLFSDAQLLKHLRQIATVVGTPTGIAIGLAGAWLESDWKRIRTVASRVWPTTPCYATNDLETALTAAANDEPESPTVLIVSGTGSCCYGKSAEGQGVKVGGWGHVLGDKGSGYEIGLRGLKATIYHYDQQGVWPALGVRLLNALQMNSPFELISWAYTASKSEVAALAVPVFAAWEAKDQIARDIIQSAVNTLARDGAACARRLFGAKPPVRFVLAGSLLLKEKLFATQVSRQLQRLRPGSKVMRLQRESVWGAVELAIAKSPGHRPQAKGRSPKLKVQRVESRTEQAGVKSLRMSPTEQRHPRSMQLDKMALSQAIKLMLDEDATIPGKLLGQRRAIERAIRAIAKSFRTGGRLLYVGAGTSGRLGVLDASECPPTFRTPPELVQGIIAGGQAAVSKSIEGAEDDVDAGGRAIGFRAVNQRDVVVGIAASGTTPFVWGALCEAKARKATTVLVCFNGSLQIPKVWRPAIMIAPELGPELLTGSTRLKAGTATKLVLNMLSTLAMVRSGKVISNLMVDLLPGNNKLRDRAVRIVQELTGMDAGRAKAALVRGGWIIKKAIAGPGRRR